MQSSSNNDLSSVNNGFKITRAVASAALLKLETNQLLDIDMAPLAEDFSLAISAPGSQHEKIIAPALVEIKSSGEHQPSSLLLVLDEELPIVKNIELRYHPKQVLMWSQTTDESIEPFSAQITVKYSDKAAAKSAKLLEAIRSKTQKSDQALAMTSSPPEILSVSEGNTVTIALNKIIATHQGVSVADFKADTEGKWLEIINAVVNQPENGGAHQIQLQLKQNLKIGSEINVVFKAKRHPIVGMDGTQISGFKCTAKYIDEQRVESLENTSQTTVVNNARNPQAQSFYLKDLEHSVHDTDNTTGAIKGFFSAAFLGLLPKSVRQKFSTNNEFGEKDQTAFRLNLWMLILGVMIIFVFVGFSVSNLTTTPDTPNQITANTHNTISDNKCSLTFQNGGYYSGECKNNLPHGFGVFEWSSGSRYEGEFKNGMRWGFGKIVYANGSKYDGAWKNDKKNGIGTYWNAGGDRFEGELSDGLMTGNGTCHKRDGTEVRGVCPP
mgnify:CR=1 FL=1